MIRARPLILCVGLLVLVFSVLTYRHLQGGGVGTSSIQVSPSGQRDQGQKRTENDELKQERTKQVSTNEIGRASCRERV